MAFTFQPDRSRAVQVALTRTRDGIEMEWPAIPDDWDTAVLEVRVTTDDTNSAYAILGSATTSACQYFARNDAGLRWLNVSGLRSAVTSGRRVAIGERHLRISDGMATLRLFTNRLDLSEPTLVLAPHPDDAEIAAFALYAHRDAAIVTITAGNAGPGAYRLYESETADSADMYTFKGQIRAIDSVTIPWQGGILPDRCFNLGYFDARLQEMYESPTTGVAERYTPNRDVGVYRRLNIGSLLPKNPRAATWRNLVDDLLALLNSLAPRTVVSPHPLLDTHPDHQFTTVALTEAMARWRRPVTLLLYSSHADGNRYPYGPAGTVMSLPPPPRDVTLDSVYSHPVDARTRRQKLFALESMHDVRFQDVTYLRRADRSNELFYVYSAATIAPVIETFLSTRTPLAHAGQVQR